MDRWVSFTLDDDPAGDDDDPADEPRATLPAGRADDEALAATPDEEEAGAFPAGDAYTLVLAFFGARFCASSYSASSSLSGATTSLRFDPDWAPHTLRESAAAPWSS